MPTPKMVLANCIFMASLERVVKNSICNRFETFKLNHIIHDALHGKIKYIIQRPRYDILFQFSIV